MTNIQAEALLLAWEPDEENITFHHEMKMR